MVRLRSMATTTRAELPWKIPGRKRSVVESGVENRSTVLVLLELVPIKEIRFQCGLSVVLGEERNRRDSINWCRVAFSSRKHALKMDKISYRVSFWGIVPGNCFSFYNSNALIELSI